jgi:hypothetical protein
MVGGERNRMSDHILEELPFYINNTLPLELYKQVDAHLSDCQSCRNELADWEQIAHVTREDYQRLSGDIPTLSPIVRNQVQAPQTFIQGLQSALGLIWVQRVIILPGGVMASVTLAVALGVIATARFGFKSNPLFLIPLLILVPCLAVIAIGFIYNEDTDPAYEVLLATPTPTAVLIFSRLTLALSLIVGLSFLGSLLLDFTGVGQLGNLVMVWLGPMLLLSGLTTVLVLNFGSFIATGISLTLWIATIVLLVAEIEHVSMFNFSLAGLINPNGWLFFSQLIIAAMLWFLGWKSFIHDGQGIINLDDS